MQDNNESSTKKSKRPYQDPVNKDDVKEIIKRAFEQTSVKILNHHMRIFSEEKLGFMGSYRHLVVTIQRQGSTDHNIVTFFLKAIPHDIEEQALLIQESNTFCKEITFYKNIVPELMSAVKDKAWLAQCYLTKDDVMVFEDLNAKNFTLKDKHLDAPALKAALTGLAKLHASSILAEKRLGRTFRDLYPDVFVESLFVRKGRFNDWFRSNVDVIVAMAKRLRLDYECVVKVCDKVYELVLPSEKWPNVICHGDAKSFNFLFDDSIILPRCVLVDFQLIRYVPQTIDVAQLLYLNSSRTFRDNHERQLLKYYHEAFCAVFMENVGDVEIGNNWCLGFKELLEQYEETRVFGLISSAASSPLNLMDGNVCEELTKDSDGFSKVMFGDHVDVVFNYMEQDAAYRDIISDLVLEIVQRSDKILRS